VDGAVDFAGYERLLEHYLGQGVSGVFPLGTTGESPTLDEDEMEAIVERTVTLVAGRVPVFVGVGGNATRKVLATLKRFERHRFEGIVSVCPYRTSVNLANDTLLRLAELPTSSASRTRPATSPSRWTCCGPRPEGFAVMTGDDASFYTMLAHGAVTGISRALADELDRALKDAVV
jgi:4-hydroxy-tetrahydrodipicolinate synthase